MKRLSSFPISIVKKTSSQYNKAFHAKLFTLFASSESEVHTFAHEHTPHYRYCFAFMKDDEGQWFLDIDGITKIRAWVLKGARRGTGHVMKLYRTWCARFERFRALSQSLQSVNLKRLSDAELLRLFRQYYDAYLKVGSIAYVSDSFMSTGETDWLETLLQKELSRINVNEGVAGKVRLITSPTHRSFALEEELGLLRIAVMLDAAFPGSVPPFAAVAARNPRIVRALKRHEQRFHWVRNNYYHVEYISASNAYRRARAVVVHARTQRSAVRQLYRRKSRELMRIRAQRQQLLNALPLSPFHRNVLDIAKLFAQWKDARKGGDYLGMFHFDRFLNEIARRKRVPRHVPASLCFDEIIHALRYDTPLPEDAYQREHQSFFAITPRGYFTAAGARAKPYFKYFMHGQPTEAQSLNGVSASPGIAKGRVRIIRKTGDMRLFRTGEVLITNQTTPEFVPIMKKACAIVTEQGGITSHAAVVSRELKKPCIIGTKIATRVLKDGYRVEVDANKGTVVVLKK